MKSSLLSIIVPIYNVEPYLRKCVESLLAQDLNPDEYEIILVDDGSTDNCPAICDEYAQSLPPLGGSWKGANVRVIHQPNGGLSAARNTGIRAAKGDYVCFVDSDDYWEPNVLGGLMAQVERDDLDVLRFDYQNVRISQAGDYEVFQPYKHPHQVDQRIDVVNGETYLNERMGYECYAVQFIVRRSLLVGENHKSPILFSEGIHFEDVDWTPRMLLAAKRVSSARTIAYNYLLRAGSITVSPNLNGKKKNAEDTLRVIKTLGGLYAEYPLCQWLKDMQSSMTSGVLCTIAEYFYSERHFYIKQLRHLNALPLRIANQGKTYKRRAILTNISPYLFCTSLHITRRLIRK